jgi:PAS domain S-box-containing protein
VNPEPEKPSDFHSLQDDSIFNAHFFEKLSVFLGLLIAITISLGTAGLYLGIISPDTKPISFSAALIWIVIGLVIVFYQLGKIRNRVAIVVQALLIFIAAVEAIEIPLSLRGSHFIIESLSVQAGNIILGRETTPISPITSLLIVVAALGLILVIRRTGHAPGDQTASNVVGGLGIVMAFVSFTFILGYLYGSPFLYGTQYIPISLASATAAFFTGIAFVTMAGTAAFPLRHFVGDSTRARLLRTFVPLTGIIILAENLMFVALTVFYPVQGAIRVAASLVLFIIITSYAVGRLSSGLGWALDQAEDLLVRKNRDLNQVNEELNASNEELMAAEEELRHTVTVLTKMENELRESGQRLKRAQEIAHLGSWDLDLINDRLSWSDEVYRIFGLDPKEFGRTFEAFIEAVHPDDRMFVDKTYEGSVSEGKNSVEIEHRIIRPGTGEVRFVHEKCEHIKDGTGRIVRSIGMVHDITERKRAEEALRQANAKINMLSSITRHDILNKITALRSYLELSRHDIQEQEMLNYIAKEDDIAKIIAEQIEFTRFYEEMGVHSPSWQDIPEIIRNSVSQLNLAGITVDIGIAGLEVYADPLIGKVFYNLLDNSIRHGIHVNRIRFAFNENHNGGTIVYTDDGAGVPTEYKKKIFAKGFGNNTGLGLFLSREILSITGITIEETGMPGKGVQFELGIPNEYYRTPSR